MTTLSVNYVERKDWHKHKTGKLVEALEQLKTDKVLSDGWDEALEELLDAIISIRATYNYELGKQYNAPITMELAGMLACFDVNRMLASRVDTLALSGVKEGGNC